jgi:hypothetical protein
MGCSLSSSPIGRVVVTLTPTDNLDVGSFAFIHDLELSEAMFKRKSLKNNEKTSKNAKASTAGPAVCLSLPQLDGAISQLSIAFTFHDTFSVESGKIELRLMRNDEVVQTKELFHGSPMVLRSASFGCKIANPLVNLAQTGDFYQICIFHS